MLIINSKVFLWNIGCDKKRFYTISIIVFYYHIVNSNTLDGKNNNLNI